MAPTFFFLEVLVVRGGGGLWVSDLSVQGGGGRCGSCMYTHTGLSGVLDHEDQQVETKDKKRMTKKRSHTW